MCQRLRELEIYLCFQDCEQDLHQLVYERLSTLIRLERLTIQHPYSSTIDANEGLAFRLDCGLGRLASLQQLTYFCIRTTHNGQLGMEEVVWMVDNLRKLRKVVGNLNRVEEVKSQLVSVFESHGIAVDIDDSVITLPSPKGQTLNNMSSVGIRVLSFTGSTTVYSVVSVEHGPSNDGLYQTVPSLRIYQERQERDVFMSAPAWFLAW